MTPDERKDLEVNEVIYKGRTLINLREDTITPEDLMPGVTAHDKSGKKIVGTNNIHKLLDNEIDRATKREDELDEKIQAETTRATEAEEELDQKVAEERNRATSSEEALGREIDAEISRATEAEREIDQKIEDEKTRATGAEADLEIAIENEMNRAVSAEQNLNKKINANTQTAKNYTDQKVADLINGAPETLDTLKEVADAIEEHRDVTDALNEAIGKKAPKNPEFTEATERANIESGEDTPTLFGKIKKWFSDLKKVAFSGKYGDLSGLPRVNGLVLSAGQNTNFATCTTPADNHVKEITIGVNNTKFDVVNGSRVEIRFTNGCPSSAASDINYLKINGGEQYPLMIRYNPDVPLANLRFGTGAKDVVWPFIFVTDRWVIEQERNTWKVNTKTSEGYVPKGTGHPNQAWATDANGNPGWRDYTASGNFVKKTGGDSMEGPLTIVREDASVGQLCFDGNHIEALNNDNTGLAIGINTNHGGVAVFGGSIQLNENKCVRLGNSAAGTYLYKNRIFTNEGPLNLNNEKAKTPVKVGGRLDVLRGMSVDNGLTHVDVTDAANYQFFPVFNAYTGDPSTGGQVRYRDRAELQRDTFAPTWHWQMNDPITTNNTWHKIYMPIPPGYTYANAYWMISFNLEIYGSYIYRKLSISGYFNGAEHWYAPNATCIDTSDMNINNIFTVVFGYDDDGRNWIAVPATSYVGYTISAINTGFLDIMDDWCNAFSIVETTTLGISQASINTYRPAKLTDLTIAPTAYKGVQRDSEGKIKVSQLMCYSPIVPTEDELYNRSAIQVNEAVYGRELTGSNKEAPRIGFHWRNRNGGSLAMNYKGEFLLNTIDGINYAKLYAALYTETGKHVESEINSLKNSVSNGKAAVANAITSKGVSTATTADFATLAANVGKITAKYPNTYTYRLHAIDLLYNNGITTLSVTDTDGGLNQIEIRVVISQINFKSANSRANAVKITVALNSESNIILENPFNNSNIYWDNTYVADFTNYKSFDPAIKGPNTFHIKVDNTGKDCKAIVSCFYIGKHIAW